MDPNVDHKMVQVNAFYRSTGTTNNFTIDFKTRDLDRVTKVTMIKATLPRTFTNIWSVNNTINIQHPAGIDNIFVIPPGQYTASTLATAMTTACAGISMAFTYSGTTERYTATYSGVTTATIALSGSTIADYVGLTADITLGAPTAFQSPPQLSGPDEVQVRSNLVAATSTVSAAETAYVAILGNINFTDVPYGFTGRMDAQNLDIAHVDFPGQVCMRKMDIQLTDVWGDLINTPDNCYLDMILQFSY
jgi:hypothetical protein